MRLQKDRIEKGEKLHQEDSTGAGEPDRAIIYVTPDSSSLKFFSNLGRHTRDTPNIELVLFCPTIFASFLCHLGAHDFALVRGLKLRCTQ